MKSKLNLRNWVVHRTQAKRYFHKVIAALFANSLEVPSALKDFIIVKLQFKRHLIEAL